MSYNFFCAVLALRGVQRADVLAAFEETNATGEEQNLGGFIILWDGEEPGTFTLELRAADENILVSIWQNDRGEFKCNISDVVFFSNPEHRDPSTDSMFWRKDYDGRVYNLIAPDEMDGKIDNRSDAEIELDSLLTCIANLAVLHAPSDRDWDGKVIVSPGDRGDEGEQPATSGDNGG